MKMNCRWEKQGMMHNFSDPPNLWFLLFPEIPCWALLLGLPSSLDLLGKKIRQSGSFKFYYYWCKTIIWPTFAWSYSQGHVKGLQTWLTLSTSLGWTSHLWQNQKPGKDMYFEGFTQLYFNTIPKGKGIISVLRCSFISWAMAVQIISLN